MIFIKFLLTVLLFSFNIGLSNAQSNFIYTPKEITNAQLIEDYEILYNSLINYHPEPYRYMSELDLKKFVDKQISSFPEELNELEFHVLVRHLIAEIKCGHTYGKPSKAWYEAMAGQKIYLPFDIKIIQEKVYVNNQVSNDFEWKVDDEILSINGIPISEIIASMSLIHERDGQTFAFIEESIIKKFRIYYLFLFGIEENIQVVFKQKNGSLLTSEIKLSNVGLKTQKDKDLPSFFKPILSNDWSLFALDTIHNIGYLKIESFNDRKAFKKYYKSVFKSITALQCENIIIDLRNNSGGYFGNGNNLLTYLTPENFNYNFQRSKAKIEENEHVKLNFVSKLTNLAFSMKPARIKKEDYKTVSFKYKPNKLLYNSKINVLINGATFSQAALVAAQLNQNGATFFGQETGGTESSTNAMINYKLTLPNSGLQINIPYYTILSNSNQGTFGYGVMPDVEIQKENDKSNEDYILKVISEITN